MPRSIMSRVQEMLFAVLSRYQQILPKFPALLGDGHGTVAVEGMPQFVYVRMGAEGEDGLAIAFNQMVQLRDGLPVIVGYDPVQPRLFQVLSQREVYVGTGQASPPRVVPHHWSHEFPIKGDPRSDGSDLVTAHWRQVRGLRTIVKPGEDFIVQLESWHLRRGAIYKWLATQELDLEPDVPLVGACFVLCYVDAAGVYQKRVGETVIPATAIDFDSHCPATVYGEWASAAVLLFGGMGRIIEDSQRQDIYDLRFPEAFSPGDISLGNLIDVDFTVPAVDEDVLTYDEASGMWIALALPTPDPPKTVTAQFLFTIEGPNLGETGDKPLRIYAYLDTGVTGTVVEVFAAVATPPPTTAVRLAVKKNGVNIIDAPGYVEIPVDGYTGSTTSFLDADIAAGDYYTFEVVQGDAAAADLTLHVRYKY